MRRPAAVAAIAIIALGALAIIAPPKFAGVVSLMQDPPMLYVAALIRVTIGATFLLAYPHARGRIVLFFLGVVMVMGGIVTPIIGQGLARPILDAWLQGGDWVVRGWGFGAILLGVAALVSLRPRTPVI